jgi:hypothetical protein
MERGPGVMGFLLGIQPIFRVQKDLLTYAYFSYLENIEIGLCDHHAVSVCPPYQLLMTTALYETWYHGT